MIDAEASDQLDRALEAVEAVQNDPKQAKAEAEDILAGQDLDPEAAVVAWWAVGLASRQLNELNEAHVALEKALQLALDERMERREGQIRSSLSLVLLYRGDSQAALAQAEQASRALAGADKARNEMQIGLIYQRLGRLEDSLAHYRRALTSLRRHGDRLGQARLLANRGVLHGYRGELDAGVSDLETATRIAEDLGQSLIVGACAHNLGFLEGRRGDIPAALAWFDRAETAYDDLGRPPGMVEVLQANRAELLLSAGLVSEADHDVRQAIAGLEKSDNRTDLAEARLLAAEVELAAGRTAEALETAATASADFLEQDRHAWRLLAEYARLRAEFTLGVGDGAAVGRAADLASELRNMGMSTEALHSTLLAGRFALRSGDLATARGYLQSASSARRRGSAMVRAQAWHAEALLRQAEGRHVGTSRALDAGFRVIRNHRLTLGASELRSHAAALGLDLARLAVQRALDSGSPWRVLKAVESWRAESTRVAAAHSPNDPELTSLLAELRRLKADIRDSAVTEAPSRHASRKMAELRKIELDIRSTSRRLRGSGMDIDPVPLTRDSVLEWTADRHLISYFTFGGHIHGVSVFRGKMVLQDLVEADRARSEVASLLFSLNRLNHRRSGRDIRGTAIDSLDASLTALRQALTDPLALGEERLVIVPSAALHRLPWPALDTGTVVSVAPSLEASMTASSRSVTLNDDALASLIAGPGLPGAVDEIASITKIYRNRRRRTGRQAVAHGVLKDMEDAAVAHIAAHGVFRHDNPSFSALEMYDGPLTVYDFEQLHSLPAVMVLSSCDTAVSQVVAGDELLGLSSALISRGVSSLIAPVVPILDDVAGDLMVAVHKHLISGESPPRALATAMSEWDDRSGLRRALCASLVAFGA